jgi:flagellar biosynthesis chaperone FliJ
MALGSIDQDIAELIHQDAVAKNVTVIITAIAEMVATEHIKKVLKDLDSAIHDKQGHLEALRHGFNEIERQWRLPNAEAQIAALPKDIAEKFREAREALPGWALKMQEVETQIAELGEAQKRLKRKMSASKLVLFLKTGLISGSWKGILLQQDRFDDDWYSATAATEVEVESYGPLSFLWECPQRPEPRAEPSVAHNELPTEVSEKRRPSWLRRLLG